MPHCLFVFLDGVGFGPAGEANPFSTLHLPGFSRLGGGNRILSGTEVRRETHTVKAIDACLGVEGLPQSGTGQATLFSGVNGAQLAGRHYGPFPHSATRAALREKNVFRRIKDAFPDHEEPAVFANAFPERFFAWCKERDRWTVTTRCCLDAGVTVRTTDALESGEALAADLTAEGLVRLGLEVPLLTSEQAAATLHALSRRHVFTLFEFFLTDKAGHSRSHERAATVLTRLDSFFDALLSSIDPGQDLLVVTSDHGNLEDLSTKTHTRNPVPLIAVGRGSQAFVPVKDLTGVVPAIMEALSW